MDLPGKQLDPKCFTTIQLATIAEVVGQYMRRLLSVFNERITTTNKLAEWTEIERQITRLALSKVCSNRFDRPDPNEYIRSTRIKIGETCIGVLEPSSDGALFFFDLPLRTLMVAVGPLGERHLRLEGHPNVTIGVESEYFPFPYAKNMSLRSLASLSLAFTENASIHTQAEAREASDMTKLARMIATTLAVETRIRTTLDEIPEPPKEAIKMVLDNKLVGFLEPM